MKIDLTKILQLFHNDTQAQINSMIKMKLLDLQDYINLDSASRWTHLLMIPPCNQLCHSTLVQKIIILLILKHVLRQSCLLWQAVDLDSN